MNRAIVDFINCKRIAIVGASRTGGKFGNISSKELKARGYEVYLIHPEAQEIDGERCYPNLESLRGIVECVFISVSPQKAGDVLREAVNAGITKIWLQRGAQSPDTIALADELGITPVTDKCILMYAQPVRGFHHFHRVVNQVFGQL